VRASLRNVEGRDEKETVRLCRSRGNGSRADGIRRRGSRIRHESERGIGNFRRGFEKRGRHVFAGLHRRDAYEVAAASENGLAAEGYDVLALFDQEGLLGPLDVVAFAKGAEGGDVFGERKHGGVAVGAIAVKVVENRIVVDTLEEFVDGAEAAAEEGEVEGTERCVDDRSGRGGRSGRRQGVGVLILSAGRAGYRRRGLGPVCVVEGSKDKIATNEQDEGEKNSLIVHRICSISTGEKNPKMESDWRGVRVIAPLENCG